MAVPNKPLNPNTTTAKRRSNKVPKDFNVLKAIRAEKDYKSNVKRRDINTRKYMANNLPTKWKKSIIPGQLVMFNYLEPKFKEELEYYDAMPCTIFFGLAHTKNGLRVIGFNIHYYPPPMRFRLMDRIFEIFKPCYQNHFNKPLTEEVPDFNYKLLMKQLRKAKLDFGIREYIPSLMHKVTPIPVSAWSKAVLTEGHFRKETREQILNYWKNKSLGIDTEEKDKKKQ